MGVSKEFTPNGQKKGGPSMSNGEPGYLWLQRGGGKSQEEGRDEKKDQRDSA